MTMTMKISLFDTNHLNAMLGKNNLKKNIVVNVYPYKNKIECRYRRPIPYKISLIAYKVLFSLYI